MNTVIRDGNARRAVAAELERLATTQGERVRAVGARPGCVVLPTRTPSEIATLTFEKPISFAPYIFANSITQFTGYAKRGKTSFLLYLVGCIVHGVECMGEPTTETGVVYLTEERLTPLRAALARAGLLEAPQLHLVSRWDVPSVMSWAEIIAAAVNTCVATNSRVLVVDTFPSWAGLRGDDENNAGPMLAALEPVQRAAKDGRAIVLVQHDRKGGGAVGESGRGSSAFAGAVDTILTLRRPEGNTNPNRRTLEAVSRFDDVPEAMIVERTIDGREGSDTAGSKFEKKLYVPLGKPGQIEVRRAEQATVTALIDAGGPLTIDALAKALPETALATINRALKALVPLAVERAGTGKRGSPYTYSLRAEVSSQTSI